jgi:hypothetical protein
MQFSGGIFPAENIRIILIPQTDIPSNPLYKFYTRSAGYTFRQAVTRFNKPIRPEDITDCDNHKQAQQLVDFQIYFTE